MGPFHRPKPNLTQPNPWFNPTYGQLSIHVVASSASPDELVTICRSKSAQWSAEAESKAQEEGTKWVGRPARNGGT